MEGLHQGSGLENFLRFLRQWRGCGRHLKLIEYAAARQFKPVAHAQFVEQAEKIDLHCPFGDTHFAGDLLVPHPLAEQGNDFALSRR